MITAQLLVLGIFIGIPIGLMISLAIMRSPLQKTKQRYEKGI